MNHSTKRGSSGIPTILVLVAIALILGIAVNASAQSEEHALSGKSRRSSTAPVDNSGKKWRIAYIEGGLWPAYAQNLTGIIEHLMELGWIERTSIPIELQKHGESLWQWLSNNLNSDYISLLPDAFWSSNWDTPTRETNKARLLNRIRTKKDIDLIIAAGTWAGLDLANNHHSVPVIVTNASDPIAAGIIQGADNSGYGHVHAYCDPDYIERQFRLFHQVVSFTRLGLPYTNTKEGRSYAGIDAAIKVAEERGFEIVHYHLPQLEPFDKEAELQFGLAALEKLGKEGIDGIFLSANTAFAFDGINSIVETLLKYKIPSFAQLDPESRFVRHGILMSFCSSLKYKAIFQAQTIAKVFNGAKPGQLEQVLEVPDRIVLNYKTAKLMGIDIPDFAFEIADAVYADILE